MHTGMIVLTIGSFLLTMLFVFWRPKGINEAIPATGGALLVLLSGSVTWQDLGTITVTVGGAAVTILATMMMANVLESFGIFHWVAERIAMLTKGSGIRLFWFVNALCFLMTMFFNNDGSILMTTPILLILLKNLGLKPQQQIPYLISGALIATAASAPIGVSNIVNLIALKIVNMTLNDFTAMMFVPATLGLGVLLLLLFAVFRRHLLRNLPDWRARSQGIATDARNHPLKTPPTANTNQNAPARQPSMRFVRNVLLFVFAVRVSLFVVSSFGIPVEVAAVFGSVVLLIWRWAYLKISPVDMLKKTPWYILLFAFSMYVVIYGLHKIGLTNWIVLHLQSYVQGNLLDASFIMGWLVTLMSDLFNNHPALMIGTLTLTNMHLAPLTLKLAYLSNVIGSDIGSLILPIGTLATLMWMHIVRRGNVKVTWGEYVKVTLRVIPLTVLCSLVFLYVWVTILL